MMVYESVFSARACPELTIKILGRFQSCTQKSTKKIAKILAFLEVLFINRFLSSLKRFQRCS